MAVNRTVLAAGIILLLAGLAAAQPAPAPSPLDAARKLIAEGKADQARPALEAIVRDCAGKPEADEAAKLLERIKTVEVLLDYSHEFYIPVWDLPSLLIEDGIGAVHNHAYVGGMREQLPGYEMVVLWQETTDVAWDDLECEVLRDYVQSGGRLLIVANPDGWARAHGGSARGYPLLSLARKLGFKLQKESEELPIGQGKAFYVRNTGALSHANMTTRDAAQRRRLIDFFTKFLPYRGPEKAQPNRWIEPEIKHTEGRARFHYAQPLEKQAGWVKKALPKVLAFYAKTFKEDLPADVSIYSDAGLEEQFQPGTRFTVSLCTGEEAVLHQLTMELFQVWMKPEGKPRYPQWLDQAWSEMVAVDVLTQLGLGRGYAGTEAYRRRTFRAEDPNMSGLNIAAGPRTAGDWAYLGKCEFIYRNLSQKYGDSMLQRLRETVVLYQSAGKLPEVLSTEETIRLLSLAVGKNLFPYFQSLGTRVQPLPVDLTEPDRLRRSLGVAPPAGAGK